MISLLVFLQLYSLKMNKHPKSASNTQKLYSRQRFTHADAEGQDRKWLSRPSARQVGVAGAQVSTLLQTIISLLERRVETERVSG